MEQRAEYGPWRERPRLTVIHDEGATYSALPHAVLFDARLSDSAVRLYAVLQSHWWQGGECWASHATLSAQMRVQERQIRRLIRELKEAGWISERSRGIGQAKAYKPVDSASQQDKNDRLNGSEMSASEPNRTKMTGQQDKNVLLKRTKMSAQYRTIEEDTYGSKNKERNAANAAPAPAEVKPKIKAESRATRLPADWCLTDAHFQAATKRGFDSARAEAEGEKFADYHRAKGTRMLDWLAAWRTWLGNAVEFDKRRPPHPSTNGTARMFPGEASKQTAWDDPRYSGKYRHKKLGSRPDGD